MGALQQNTVRRRASLALLPALIGQCCGGDECSVASRCISTTLRSHRTDRPGTSRRTHAPFRLFSCSPPPLLFHVLLVQVSVITLSQSLFWKAVGYPEFVTSRGEIIITRPHSSVSMANAFLFFKSKSVVVIIHALTPGCLEFSPSASDPHKSAASSCVRSAHIFSASQEYVIPHRPSPTSMRC